MSTIKILDGGLATQLSRHVGDRVDGDPLWTARFLAINPEAIVKTHLDFLRAGSDYIETFTYQASIPGFVQYLNVSPEEALALIRKAADLAIEAKELYLKECPSAKTVIVGSIGPYGAVLHDGSEYTGSYADKISKEELIEWHRPRINELVKGGIEVFAFETIPCRKEGEALVDLLREFPNIKAWFSFSCKDDKNLVHGENFQETSEHCYYLNPDQIIAIGANCLSPHNVHNLFSGINVDPKHLKIPLVVYPNSGEKYTVEEGWKTTGDIPPIETFVYDWLDLGVRYIGGCCRTYADDVTQIKKKVESWKAINL